MDDRLLTLTAAALAGLASRPGGGHADPHEAGLIGKRAAELGRAALAALEDAEAAPELPKPRKR